METQDIATAVEQKYLELRERMRNDILQTIGDIEWAEECEAEKEATLRNGSGVY